MADERFSGDMSRNEVEIDLNKFMEMVKEIGELKQTIMELENEKEPDNPYQKWIWLSNMIDANLHSPSPICSSTLFIHAGRLNALSISFHIINHLTSLPYL